MEKEKYNEPNSVKKVTTNLQNASKNCHSIDDFLDLIFSFKSDEVSIQPIQIKSEIRALLKILERKKPKTVLEIGTAKGGTLFLLCKVSDPKATIVSIDLPGGPFGGQDFQDWKLPLYQSFAGKKQTLDFIKSDSHSQKTLRQLKKILGKRKIDFLLIDGDHTYKGVKKDFKMYSPLVSKGGLVILHDINSGPKSLVGGVPKFWDEIKSKFAHGELVDDYNSNEGYGIGIISYKPAGKVSTPEMDLLKGVIEFKEAQLNTQQKNVHAIKSQIEASPLGVLSYIFSKRADLREEYPEVVKGDYARIVSWAISVIEGQIKDKERGNKSLSKFLPQYRDYQKSFNRAQTELSEKIKQINLQNEKIENQNKAIRELEFTKKTLEGSIEANAAKIKEKEQEQKKNVSKIGELEFTKKTLEGSIEANVAKITKLETENLERSNNIKFLEQENQEFKNQVSDLKAELDTLSNSIPYLIARDAISFLDEKIPPKTRRGKILRKLVYNRYKKKHPEHIQLVEPEFLSEYVFDDIIEKGVVQRVLESLKYQPKISIIMPVFNPKISFLKKAIKSVKNQYYTNWQLCICDDGSTDTEIHKILRDESSHDQRMNVTFSKENGGISDASNKALELADGEYTILLDNDDELSKNAILETVKAINENPDVDFIYSDEDKLDNNGEHVEPFFKPDWSPDLHFSYNYPIHISVFRTSLIKEIEGFRKGFEGAQDYDLILRYLECSKKVVHIPKVLYSWRKSPGSMAFGPFEKSYAIEAGRKALTEALSRRKIDAVCEEGIQLGSYRVKYRIKNNPLVSIIIPSKNLENLRACIDSIQKKSTYRNFEIVVMDSSKDDDVKKFCQKYTQIICEKVSLPKFNFSQTNNSGVKKSNGDYIIFLNDDTEVINPDWIESLLEHAQRDQVGIVGAKLLYRNDRIQHAGTIVGIQRHAGNYGGMHKTDAGYFSFAKIIRNCSAVTAACMMIKKELFSEIGGFDEEMANSWQDVDLCIRILNSGKFIVYTPYSLLYHYEGGTRGSKDSSEAELEARRIFRKKNSLFIKNGDPYYNPNFSLTTPYNIVKSYPKPLRDLVDLYERRSDLRKSFPHETYNNFRNMIDWAATHGIVTDGEKEILKPHIEYYFERCSEDAKPLASNVKLFLEDKELQKKFPEVYQGDLKQFLKYMENIPNKIV